MNKKAFEIRTVFIGIVLAMFIIALFFLFITGAGRDLLIRTGVIVPTLNASTTLILDSEIIRYDISQDKVQWYDSVNFWDFDKNGQASFNKKTLQDATIKNDFMNYYYNHTIRDNNKWVNLGSKENILIYDSTDNKEFARISFKTPPQLNLFLIGLQYPSGDVDSVLRSKNTEDRKVYGEMILKGNSLELIKINYNFEGLNYDSKKTMGQSNELYKLIVPQLNTWRFSILSKPIKISYKENNLDTSNYFCVSFYNPSYLKVDLFLPVQQDTVCPIAIL